MNPLEIFLLLAGLGILLGVALWAWAASRLIDIVVESYSHGGNKQFPTTAPPPGVEP